MGAAVRIGIGGDAGELVGAVDDSIKVLMAFADKAEKIFGGFKDQVAKAFDWDAQVAKGGHVTQQAFGQLELLVKGMAGQVQASTAGLAKFADQLSAVSKFSNEAAVDVERLFLAMGTLDESGVKRATVAAADSAAKTGESFEKMAVMIRDAMRDPIARLDDLRAAGVAFTNEEIASLKVMKEANNVAGMQAAILGKVEKAMDGAANKGASKFTDAMQKLGNAWEDVGQLIADNSKFWDVFAPLIEKVADTIRSALIPAVRVAIDTIASFQDVIKKAFSAGWDLAVTGAAKAFSAIEVIVKNWNRGTEIAFAAIGGYATTAFKVLDNLFYVKFPEYTGWFKANWLSAVQDAAKATETAIQTGAPGITASVAKTLGDITSAILPTISAVLNTIPPLVKAVAETIPPILAGLLPQIEAVAVTLTKPFVDAFAAIIPPLWESLKTLIDAVSEYTLATFGKVFKELGKILADAVLSGLKVGTYGIVNPKGVIGGEKWVRNKRGQLVPPGTPEDEEFGGGNFSMGGPRPRGGKGSNSPWDRVKAPDFSSIWGKLEKIVEGLGRYGIPLASATKAVPMPSFNLPGTGKIEGLLGKIGADLDKITGTPLQKLLRDVQKDFKAAADKNQDIIDGFQRQPNRMKEMAEAQVNASRGKGGAILGGGKGGAADTMALGLESLTALNDRITAAAGIGSSTNPTVKAVNKAAEVQRADAAKAFAERVAARKEAAKQRQDLIDKVQALNNKIQAGIGGMVP